MTKRTTLLLAAALAATCTVGCGAETHEDLKVPAYALAYQGVLVKGPIFSIDGRRLDHKFLRDPDPVTLRPGKHRISLDKPHGIGPPPMQPGLNITVHNVETIDLVLNLEPSTAYEFSLHGLNGIVHIYNATTRKTTCFDPETMVYFDEKTRAPIDVKDAFTP